MASLLNIVDVDYTHDISTIVDQLSLALDGLDRLGLTDAGARLAMVLDLLLPRLGVNDLNESVQAIRS
jgi:hypothetical protein